ncbi:hypothetical protein CSIM01_09765 [Colletotrichum simmondsii]|uniref:F-box domain-containing protein n=1 Tax=Colletotrichum simmondsii TaxID=703756 RepID=A0A135RXM3_9PEZI|nr:hypothetical protein CSIM01_09765 [Colletotrichum simmondsii]
MNKQSKSSPPTRQAPMPIQIFHRFPALPTEIQRLIIEAVVSEHYSPPISETIQGTCHNIKASGTRRREAQATLANVCLVSKHLKALAQPVLYRHFCLSFSWPGWSGAKFCSKGFLVLANFVATINDNPVLANMVHEVEIMGKRDFGPNGWGEDDTQTYDPIPTDLKLVFTRLRPTVTPVCILIQVLVLKARNIELLKLIMLNVSDNNVWRPLFDHITHLRDQAQSHVWTLLNLKGFRIKHSDDDDKNSWRDGHKDGMSLLDPITAKELMIPLSSPRLEELCFDRCQLVDRELPKLRKLRYLGAQNIFLSYKEMRSILNMSSTLEVFSYYSAALIDSGRERNNVYDIYEHEAWGTEACPFEVTPREISVLLLRHRKTLHTIHIFRRSMELDEESAILSLAPFKELKYLLLYGTGFLNPYSATYYPSGVRLHSVLLSILPESIVSVASNDLKYSDILNLSAELRNGEYPYLRRLWIPNWLNMKISAAREGYVDPFLPLDLALGIRNIAGRPIHGLADAASKVKNCGSGRQMENVNTVYCKPGYGPPLLDTLFKDW